MDHKHPSYIKTPRLSCLKVLIASLKELPQRSRSVGSHPTKNINKPWRQKPRPVANRLSRLVLDCFLHYDLLNSHNSKNRIPLMFSFSLDFASSLIPSSIYSHSGLSSLGEVGRNSTMMVAFLEVIIYL